MTSRYCDCGTALASSGTTSARRAQARGHRHKLDRLGGRAGAANRIGGGSHRWKQITTDTQGEGRGCANEAPSGASGCAMLSKRFASSSRPARGRLRRTARRRLRRRREAQPRCAMRGCGRRRAFLENLDKGVLYACAGSLRFERGCMSKLVGQVPFLREGLVEAAGIERVEPATTRRLDRLWWYGIGCAAS